MKNMKYLLIIFFIGILSTSFVNSAGQETFNVKTKTGFIGALKVLEQRVSNGNPLKTTCSKLLGLLNSSAPIRSGQVMDSVQKCKPAIFLEACKGVPITGDGELRAILVEFSKNCTNAQIVALYKFTSYMEKRRKGL